MKLVVCTIVFFIITACSGTQPAAQQKEEPTKPSVSERSDKAFRELEKEID